MRRPKLPLNARSPVLTPRAKKGTWQKLIQKGSSQLNNRARAWEKLTRNRSR